MIQGLPIWLNALFLLVCIYALVMFYFANDKPKALLLAMILWSVLHSFLAYSGFYETMNTLPPRFALIMIPVTLAVVFGCLPKQVNKLEDKRNMIISTFLHVLRIPVEIILYYLFVHTIVPELMTFEGRNFDIVAGISAILIGYLLIKHKLSSQVLLAWNIIGLFLVLFILTNALLSAEFAFQVFAFDQPNRAVQYFPFVLLPALVVPIVIYMHITDLLLIRRKLSNKNK